MKIKELKRMIKDAFIAENYNDDAAPKISDDYDFLDEANAPINIVTTMDGKTIVGTHQYGVGFKSNEAGKKMGFNDNPTSIPNGTKMSNDDSLYEAEEEKSLDDILADIIGTEKDPYMAEDLYEAEEEEEEIKVDAEEKIEKPANDSIVVDKKIVSLSSLPNDTRKILDSLETLRAQAEEFGDQKFITQVGNTITFFTRDFVVAGDEPTKVKVDESLEMIRMRKIAGLLTEGEYSKALLNNINENTIPSVVDILKDPKLGLKHFAKLDAYDTKFKLKDDSLAIKKLPQLKGKEVEIGGYYDPRENLLTIKSGTTSTQVYPEEVEIIASTYTDNKEDYFKKNPTETLAKK